MNKFVITADKTITCYERQLYMQVIEAQENFTADMMIIEAQLDGPFGDERAYFKINYPNLDREHTKWDMELFLDAARYYCEVVLDKEPTGYSEVNQVLFYPYSKPLV